MKMLIPLWMLSFLILLNACQRTVYPPAYYYASPSREPSTPYRSGRAPLLPPENRRSPAYVTKESPAFKGSNRTITHEVGPLETVWRLSKMYDVPADIIYAANHLAPGDSIHIGQKLIIPNARTMRHVVTLYPNTQWKYIVIHHTATDVGNAGLIHRTHHDRGFWQGLGYHFLIDNGTMGKGDGQIEVAPRWIKQQDGAHCKAGSMNDKAIGIALVGNFNDCTPTTRQMESLEYLLKQLCPYYKIPPVCIVGHRDVEGASTDCPGRRFPWPTVRQCLSIF